MLLWVDDDIDGSLKPFLDELEDSGYKVDRARNPEEMWTQLEKHAGNFDAVIMDIMLPTGDQIKPSDAQMGVTTGLVLLEMLTAEKRFGHLPVLIFTILSNQSVQDWATRHHVQCLRKQETFPEELVSAVESIVKKDAN